MQPHLLNSNTVNPANLVEIRVLSNIVTQLCSQKDIRGTIPYLAKIVQIVDNQTLEKGDYRQLNEYRKVQSDAHFDLGKAYFETQDYVSSEVSLSIAAKNWEKLVKHGELGLEDDLRAVYGYLKVCYESTGKFQLAKHMESRRDRLA